MVAPIFEHNCAYQDDPCGSQGPKHTQQKSDLQDWFLHTIWLQPPSFSIVAPEIKDKMFIRIPCEHRVIWLIFKLQSLKARDIPHFGHSLVLAEIQFDVSESSSHFLIHFLIRWHLTGSCHPSEHAKQKRWPHLKHWIHLSFEFCQKIKKSMRYYERIHVCSYLQRDGFASTWLTFTAWEQSGAGHHLSKRLHYNGIN